MEEEQVGQPPALVFALEITDDQPVVFTTDDALKTELEIAYNTFWESKFEHRRQKILTRWTNFLDVHEDKVDFCVEVLLRKDKENEIQRAKIRPDDNKSFLRNPEKNLTTQILSFISYKIDRDYFATLDVYLDDILTKLPSLNLDATTMGLLLKKGHSDLDPKHLQQLETFLDSLPHPVLNSKTLPFLIRLFCKIDELSDTDWVETIRYILDSIALSTVPEDDEKLRQLRGTLLFLPTYSPINQHTIATKIRRIKRDELRKKIVAEIEQWPSLLPNEKQKFVTDFKQNNLKNLSSVFQKLISTEEVSLDFMQEDSFLNQFFLALEPDERKAFIKELRAQKKSELNDIFRILIQREKNRAGFPQKNSFIFELLSACYLDEEKIIKDVPLTYRKQLTEALNADEWNKKHKEKLKDEKYAESFEKDKAELRKQHPYDDAWKKTHAEPPKEWKDGYEAWRAKNPQAENNPRGMYEKELPNIYANQIEFTAKRNIRLSPAATATNRNIEPPGLTGLLWQFKHAGIETENVFTVFEQFLSDNDLKFNNEEKTIIKYNIEPLYKALDPSIFKDESSSDLFAAASTQGGPSTRYPDKNEDDCAIGYLDPTFASLSEEEKEIVLEKTFAQFQEQHKHDEFQGSTAIIGAIVGNTLSVANVGDSMGCVVVMDNDGNVVRIDLINELHDFKNEKEKARVGEKNYQKDKTGNLRLKQKNGTGGSNMTRAIGDTQYGEAMGHHPDIYHKTIELLPGQKALAIFATDGFGETVPLQKYYLETLLSSKNAPKNTKDLPAYLVKCARDAGSTDNISVATAVLNPSNTTPVYVGVFDGHAVDGKPACTVSHALKASATQTLGDNIRYLDDIKKYAEAKYNEYANAENKAELLKNWREKTKDLEPPYLIRLLLKIEKEKNPDENNFLQSGFALDFILDSIEAGLLQKDITAEHLTRLVEHLAYAHIFTLESICTYIKKIIPDANNDVIKQNFLTYTTKLLTQSEREIYIKENKEKISDIVVSLIQKGMNFARFPVKNSFIDQFFLHELNEIYKREPKNQHDHETKPLHNPHVRTRFLIFFLWHLKKAGVPENRVFLAFRKFLDNNGLASAGFTEYEVKRFYRKVNPTLVVTNGAVTIQGGPLSGARGTHKNQDTHALGQITEKVNNRGFEDFNPTQKEIYLTKVGETLHKTCGQENHMGSTAILCAVSGNDVSVANKGDSLAFSVIRDKNTGEIKEFKLINNLHNRYNETERARVKNEPPEDNTRNAIPENYRLYKNGNRYIYPTRTIGDKHFDSVGVSHIPEIHQFTFRALDDNEEAFVILASDGLTERPENEKKLNAAPDTQQALHTQLVREKLDKFKGNLSTLPEYLVKKAIIEQSTDNITVAVLEAKPNDKTPRFAAVFDGHGGTKVSTELQQNIQGTLNSEIHVEIKRQEKLKEALQDLAEKTATYRTDLCQEINTDIASLFNNYSKSESIGSTFEFATFWNGKKKEHEKSNETATVMHNSNSADVKNDVELANKKIQLRRNIDGLTEIFANQKIKTDEEKLELYTKNLLALKNDINETRAGHSFLKAAFSVILAVSGIGLIFHAAYRYKTKQFFWQPEGTGLINEATKMSAELLIKKSPQAGSAA